jgi:hypothetical protein
VDAKQVIFFMWPNNNYRVGFFSRKKGIATAVAMATMTLQYGRYFGFKVI